MRGRKPSVLSLAPSDEDRLHTTADSDSLPWYQVRRARILLALAAGQLASVMSPLKWDAVQRPFGEPVNAIAGMAWRGCRHGREGRSGHLEQITPVQRAQIVELACLEPIAKGLHITH